MNNVRARYSAQATGSQARRADRRRWQDLPVFRRRPGQFLSLADSFPAPGGSGPGEAQDPCRRTLPTGRLRRSSRRSYICGKTYHLGPIRIVWYLARYHDIKISDAGVYRILRRNGLSRLPRGTRVRKIHTKRYEQTGPGPPDPGRRQVPDIRGKDGKHVKRYQYTAIDDATRIRALKVYDRHNQANAIAFIDYVIARFPFRIREVRTDNGHEFQAKFHWHVEDHGIRHAYIKPSSPQLTDVIDKGFLCGSALRCCRAIAPPSSSLLICGARTRLLGAAWVPAGDEAGIGSLGLLDPASFLIAMALDVVGMSRALLAAVGLVSRFQLEVAQLLGVERRTCPDVAFALGQ